VDYLAVYPGQLRVRPCLEEWFRINGRRIEEREVPPFLRLVYTDRLGELLIYRLEDQDAEPPPARLDRPGEES
jgi:hypothetical protein